MTATHSLAVPTHTQQIRVLDGPLRDATFDPSVRLTIGRGCDCDVQLIHDGVSRRHACIAPGSDGGHVLQDLDSTNGTFVDRQRVDSMTLKEGTKFEIMRIRFIYERAPANELAESVTLRNDGVPAHRTTVEYNAFKDKPQCAQEGERTPSVGERSRTDSPPRFHYHGDLVGDVATYRFLRVRILRGEPQSDAQVEAFERLENRMRPLEPSLATARRDFRRFSCRQAASLRLFSGDTFPVEITDLGVDGARISVGSHPIRPETLLWLAIQRSVGGASRTVVFPGRAAWVRARYIGMTFAGAPGWSQRKRSESIDRTIQEIRRDYHGAVDRPSMGTTLRLVDP